MLFSLPPTHGRLDAGTRPTMTIHGIDVTSATAPNTRLPRIRRRQVGEPMRTATPMAGTTRYAASILVLNARPTNVPARTSQRKARRGELSERWSAHTARSRRSSSHGSGRLSRLTATFTGDSASTRPATVAATSPNWRRTTTQSTATAAAPARADGSSTLQVLTPNTFADSPVTHHGTGGLSTLMNPGGSSATKNQLLQLCVAARVAAV